MNTEIKLRECYTEMQTLNWSVGQLYLTDKKTLKRLYIAKKKFTPKEKMKFIEV